MSSATLAIDQGGQSTRVLAFDERGALLARASRSIGVFRTGVRVEHDPDELVESVGSCLREVTARLEVPIRAAGLVTQRASVAAWDRESLEPLVPIISWQDRRGARWLERRDLDASDVRRRTGLRLSPHYGANKMRWCLARVARVRSAARRGRLACGPLVSFLAARLLRDTPPRVDPANAQRTLLWNIETRDWDDDLLAEFGIDRAVLPVLRDTRESWGELALDDGVVPLLAVNGDQPSTLFAGGDPSAEAIHVNLGTGAFVQRILSAGQRVPETLLRSVVCAAGSDLLCALEGTVNGAGSAIAHEARRLGIADVEHQLDSWLDGEPEPPLFLNGVSGLGSPFWRPSFRSGYVGHRGSPARRMVAVAESIVFLIQANLELLSPKGTPGARLVVSGGLSRSRPFLQRLSDLSATTVESLHEHDASARGIAYLAAGRPAEWRPAARREIVSPRSDPGLIARYHRWREELDRRLGTG